ncbi:MAG: hypothetical protein JOZ38_05055 [Candidatus Eremiobacteraeota bacterium]|nr:hypothetical protein [Candidatus Eremiobacteraeota bacterium]
MSRRFAVSLVVFVLFGFGATDAARGAGSAPYADLKWRQIGPAVSGGRIAAVAGTARDPMLYYVGSAGGGVWKSANGGATWDPVFDKTGIPSIGAIAIDPTDENVVWAGTGESNPRNDVSYGHGVFKTTDGGKTWHNVGLSDTLFISRIAIDPHHPRTVLVGALGNVFADSTARGVYRTSDGGATWKRTLYVGPASGVSDLAMDPQNPSVVYAGVWQFRREPWTFHSGGAADGLYRSSDGGITWKKLNGNGLPAGFMGRIGLAIAPSNPQRVFAIIESKSGILWRTDDGGAHWQLISKDTLVDQRPFYFSHIAVDPKDQNHVFAVSEFLAESKDGGRKFKEVAKEVHVDYHAIWIAPNDPKRIMTGEDGGYALTVDGGKTWSFSRNLAIGQIYHVGLGNEVPYTICGALQDNNAFCGPSNSLNGNGILDDHWQNVVPGDGMWAVPDLTNPNFIYTDLQDGNVSVFNRYTQQSQFIRPYYLTSKQTFALYNAPYRFNWDSPIALDPTDPKTMWYGGNVIFQTQDRGVHFTAISPDLTLNLKNHQQPAGGPLALDVSGAEYSDTILDIEGSPLAHGEIWAGTDDGLVQLTRDGGAHWTNVTPPGVGPYGRVETVAPSPVHDGTVYAIVDRHRSGDFTPYAFVSTDFGTNWRSIVSNLPKDQYVRTVRPDTHDDKLLFLGTERGMWISYDGGNRWQDFRLNLPAVSVRDIRIQPDFDDLAIATHGRSLWIFDDLTPIRELPQAQSAGAMLFKPRTAYIFTFHANDEGVYTRYAGQNPPQGAILDFYQSAPQKTHPTIEVLDASGHVVRHIAGTHKVRDKDVPFVSNDAGLNRVTWDFREDGPVQWMGALREEYRGSKTGALVVPGTYTARIVLSNKTLMQTFVVKSDPRAAWTQADYQATHDFTRHFYVMYSNVDAMLNALDDLKKALDAAQKAAAAKNNKAAQDAVAAARAPAGRVFDELTANYANDEDSIQRPGALREEIEGFFRLTGPPLPSLVDAAKRSDAEYASVAQAFAAATDPAALAPLEAALKSAGIPPVNVPPVPLAELPPY